MLAMSIKVNGQRARRMLHGIRRAATNLDPVRKDFAEYMRGSVVKNFAAGGRPAKWPKSQRAMRRGGKTLIKSGRLRSSISGRVVGRDVRVGTNVGYGKVHQFGVNKMVNQSVRAHARRTKSGRTSLVKAHRRAMRMRIPARPYLLLQREDKEYLDRRIDRHFRRVGR